MAPNPTTVDTLRNVITLTPLEDALLDALVARHRTGEVEWSIKAASSTRRALNRLIQMGAIETRPHNAATNYVYAQLTEEGRAAFQDSEVYKSPLERRLAELEAENAGLRAALRGA